MYMMVTLFRSKVLLLLLLLWTHRVMGADGDPQDSHHTQQNGATVTGGREGVAAADRECGDVI